MENIMYVLHVFPGYDAFGNFWLLYRYVPAPGYVLRFLAEGGLTTYHF